MITWSSTPAIEAIQALRDLLTTPAWQASAHAPTIRATLREELDDPNRVHRFFAAQALHLIEPAVAARLVLARERLLAESDLFIRAVLLFQLSRLPAEHAAAVDDLVAELANSGQWPLAPLNQAPDPEPVDVEHTSGDHDSRDRETVRGELVEAAVRLVLVLAVQHQQPNAAGIADRWFSDPLSNSDMIHDAAFQMRKLGMLDPTWAGSAVADTAFGLLRQATGKIVTTFEAQRSTTPRDDDVVAKALLLADTIVSQLYFASGAMAKRQASTLDPHDQAGSGAPASKAFVQRAMPLLEALAGVHHPRITHRVIETLAHLTDHDPRRVLLAIHRAVPAGADYAYEQLAVDLVVQLIQRYLAEYRDVVTSDEEALAALHEILEVFVRAGWPSAITLAYQLPDAFR